MGEKQNMSTMPEDPRWKVWIDEWIDEWKAWADEYFNNYYENNFNNYYENNEEKNMAMDWKETSDMLCNTILYCEDVQNHISYEIKRYLPSDDIHWHWNAWWGAIRLGTSSYYTSVEEAKEGLTEWFNDNKAQLELLPKIHTTLSIIKEEWNWEESLEEFPTHLACRQGSLNFRVEFHAVYNLYVWNCTWGDLLIQSGKSEDWQDAQITAQMWYQANNYQLSILKEIER